MAYPDKTKAAGIATAKALDKTGKVIGKASVVAYKNFLSTFVDFSKGFKEGFKQQ